MALFGTSHPGRLYYELFEESHVVPSFLPSFFSLGLTDSLTEWHWLTDFSSVTFYVKRLTLTWRLQKGEEEVKGKVVLVKSVLRQVWCVAVSVFTSFPGEDLQHSPSMLGYTQSHFLCVLHRNINPEL